MSFAEIVVDTVEPKEDDVMYIYPSKLSTSKYLAPNTFDQATIRNCPVEQVTTTGLIGIFTSLKPLAKINIEVFQPIAVMINYEAKQIEANLKLAGFENIQISDVTITNEKTGQKIQTQEIEAQKPESKRNVDVVVEVKKSSYKDTSRPYTKNDNRYNNISTTKTTIIESTSNTGYQPRGNRTYVQREQQVEQRPKNRTYVREEETTTTETKGGRTTGYYKRRYRSGNEN
jgi:hypothetical protein